MRLTSLTSYLAAIGATLLLSACPLTDEDKGRIDAAEDNLQKIALDPKFISPSDQEMVSGIIDVSVDIDDSVTYEKVTLQVGTEVVDTKTEGPYNFTLDTSPWADEEKISLLVKAYMTDGNVLRSEVINLVMQAPVVVEVLAPAITAPQNNELVSGKVMVQVDVDSSISYEKVILQVDNKVVAEDSLAPFILELDTDQWESQEQITVLAKAYMTDGKQLRSQAINLKLKEPVQDIVVNAPAILKPSNDAMVNGTFDVIVDVDEAIEYQMVELLASGQVIAEDAEAPYQFAIDAYFFSGLDKVSLTVNATDVNGKKHKSSIVNAVISPEANTNLAILTPLAESTFDAKDTVSISWNAIPSATGYQVQLNDDAPIDVEATTLELPFDEFDKHQVQVRAKSPQGNWGVWSDAVSFSTGLFAYAIDVKATAGWSHNDSPVDFVIDENEFVVLSSGSDKYDDGSGDSSHLTLSTISVNGEATHHKAFASFQSPTAIQKSEAGYLITTRGANWGDAAVLETSKSGDVLWSYVLRSTDRSNGQPYTNEYIYAATELDSDTVLLSRKTTNHEQYKNKPEDYWWNSKQINSKQAFEVVDKQSKSVTESVIENPSNGEYSYVNQFLITDTDIKAVGKFKSDAGGNDGSADIYNPAPVNNSGSGAVIFSLSKAGELDVAKTATGGGLANDSIDSVAQLPSGQVLVGFSGYDRSGVTEFSSELSSSDFTAYSDIWYGKVAAHASNNEYIVVGGGGYKRNPGFYLSSSPYSKKTLQVYGQDMRVEAVKYDPRYGYIVLASTEAPYVGAADSYTVLFNITESGNFITPTKLLALPNN